MRTRCAPSFRVLLVAPRRTRDGYSPQCMRLPSTLLRRCRGRPLRRSCPWIDHRDRRPDHEMLQSAHGAQSRKHWHRDHVRGRIAAQGSTRSGLRLGQPSQPLIRSIGRPSWVFYLWGVRHCDVVRVGMCPHPSGTLVDSSNLGFPATEGAHIHETGMSCSEFRPDAASSFFPIDDQFDALRCRVCSPPTSRWM